MMTSISFGASLLDPHNAALRKKISSLAYLSLSRPLRVDTLMGFDAQWVSSLQAQSRHWFLLFDSHRWAFTQPPPRDNHFYSDPRRVGATIIGAEVESKR
jgi:hypothetical protein